MLCLVRPELGCVIWGLNGFIPGAAARALPGFGVPNPQAETWRGVAGAGRGVGLQSGGFLPPARPRFIEKLVDGNHPGWKGGSELCHCCRITAVPRGAVLPSRYIQLFPLICTSHAVPFPIEFMFK